MRKIFSFIVNIGKKIWGRIFDKDDESDKRLTGKQAYVRWLADLCTMFITRQTEEIVAVYDALCLYGRYICLLDMGNGCLRGGKNQVCGFLEYLEFATARYFQKM